MKSKSKDSKIFKNLLALAHRLRIDVRFGEETESKTIRKMRQGAILGYKMRSRLMVTLRLKPQWICSDLSIPDFAAVELTHELGHYIAAPKGRRAHPNYGIKDRSKFADLDELKANFVEKELTRRFGMKEYVFTDGTKTKPEFKKAEQWWTSEGKAKVDTLLEFLT